MPPCLPTALLPAPLSAPWISQWISLLRVEVECLVKNGFALFLMDEWTMNTMWEKKEHSCICVTLLFERAIRYSNGQHTYNTLHTRVDWNFFHKICILKYFLFALYCLYNFSSPDYDHPLPRLSSFPLPFSSLNISHAFIVTLMCKPLRSCQARRYSNSRWTMLALLLFSLYRHKSKLASGHHVNGDRVSCTVCRNRTKSKCSQFVSERR